MVSSISDLVRSLKSEVRTCPRDLLVSVLGRLMTMVVSAKVVVGASFRICWLTVGGSFKGVGVEFSRVNDVAQVRHLSL